MRRPALVLSILSAGLLAWWLLSPWILTGSERFYLVLPPVCLAFHVAARPEGWRGLRSVLRPASVYIFGIIVFCTLYGFFLSFLIAPTSSEAIYRRVNWREMLIAVYFLVGIKLLLSPAYDLVRRAVYRLDDRLLGPSALDPQPRRGHGLLPQILPSVVLLPLILPYVLATLYVHRLKVPNLANPREEAGRPYEDITFATVDGLTLRGWFIPARQPSSCRTLLICHGIGANRSNFLPYLLVGDELQAHVLMFDFRGHGDSDGHTVSMGCWEKQDVLAAVDYLRRRRPAQARELFGLGISMGSSALIRAAAAVEPPFDAVIIDSGFASAVELTDSVLRIFPAAVRPWLTTPGVPLASLEAGCRLPEVRPIDQVDHLRAPVLFVHARDDEIIPVAHGQRLYERAAAPKFLWLAETGGHGGALHGLSSYLKAVQRLDQARAAPQDP